MRYKNIFTIFSIIFILITSNTYALSTQEKIIILRNYLKNLNSIKEFQIDNAVNKTINCLNLAEREVASKIDDIYRAAKDEKKTIYYFHLSKKISYCPDLRISITDDYLVPDGKFKKGMISLNYNFVKECKKTKRFGIFTSVKCDKNDIYVYLMHEFTHYAFSLLYKDWKFRDVIYSEEDNCSCKKRKCKNKKLIKTIATERRFFDEFPPTYYSYYIQFNENCPIDSNGIYKFYDNYNFIFFYGLNEYRDCVLNDGCDIYKVYILGEKMGRNTNICIDRKTALKAILELTIQKEKKIFAPKIRKLIRVLKSN
jgi:hypothetical protein